MDSGRSTRVGMRAQWLFPVVLALLGGCSSVDYYAQSISGQIDLMGRRQPIEELIADPDTPDKLRQQLELVLQLRDFASRELMLPDNGSYLSYADLEREAVVWNVVATPEFSLEPERWCYPVIGCATYRGYFSQAAAEKFAETLHQQGMDVVVQPVPAYSTLGWFDDPVPSTVIYWSAPRLGGLIFHELAHQQLYVSGDTAFNESFSSSVQQAGVERWLKAERTDAEYEAWRLSEERRQQFVEMLLAIRERLIALYESKKSEQKMREVKAELFQQLRIDYGLLKLSWEGYKGYDHWMQQAPLNNARLASIATYENLTPAFLKLLAREGGDMQAFYQACERFAELPMEQRHTRLLSFLEKPQ